jgi:splicing factor U2AF 65 kDa subunit
MFPLPGAPRQQAVDPSKLQQLMNPPGGANNETLKPSHARQSKRLFVSNLPTTASEEEIVAFFNLQLNGLNVVEAVDPCISCQISNDREFALLEFKNPGEATLALAMDGIRMEDSGMNGAANGAGAGLTIRRPKDYIVAGPGEDEAPAEGEVSGTVPDTANKLSITNILPGLDDDQVKELVSTFGSLRAFVLVRDKSTGESRGIAFCEYADPSATEMAVEGLNGMEVGGAALRVQRASVGMSQASGLEMSVNAMSMLAGTTSNDLEEGRVLQLLNMVTAEELIDQADYDEIVEDVREECEKYGQVVDIKVPRPTLGSRQTAGVGKIFIKYDTPASAKRALQSLAGRKFADRTVITTYFSEVSVSPRG